MLMDIEHKEIIRTNKKIIDRKTFYIYKFGCRNDIKIKLIIVDGIKTNPPLSEIISNADERYCDVYSIPKGIIHQYHTDWINPDIHNRVLVNDTTLICVERDDKYAIEQYKLYLQDKVKQFKDTAKRIAREAYAAKKKAKEFEDFVNNLDMSIQ